MNPGSQLNTTLLGNTVESPEEEPFMGTDNGPHSTAENQKKKLIISCSQWNGITFTEYRVDMSSARS